MTLQHTWALPDEEQIYSDCLQDEGALHLDSHLLTAVEPPLIHLHCHHPSITMTAQMQLRQLQSFPE